MVTGIDTDLVAGDASTTGGRIRESRILDADIWRGDEEMAEPTFAKEAQPTFGARWEEMTPSTETSPFGRVQRGKEVYTLGQLSRQKTDATGLGEPHQLTFLWTPFLLIHLGGQDTVTAFSVEDNELWLRHLLNLLTQVGLALYVFWKSAAHSWFLASAIFAFVAGIIKYGERIWALKSASQKALRSSTKSVIDQFPELEEDEQELGYFTMVKFALSTSPGVRNVFVGRKLEQMEVDIQAAFTGSQMGKNIQGAFICLSIYNENQNGELVFKVIEIEQGIMYENLYTKAMVLRTWAGAMLRFVTLVSLVVAFALFVADNKRWHRHSRIDVAVTLTLVTGAFCLEICAVVVMVLASPWTWAILRSCKCHKLSRAAWCIFKSVRPESRPLWSNSMGQYNFISSCFSDSVVGKVMSLVGAKQLWRNFMHTKYVDVKPEMKKLLFEDQCFQAVFGTSISPGLCANPTSGVGSALDIMLRKPFEEAILSLHIYTDIFLYRCMNPTGATSCDYTDEKRLLMHRCRTLSEYICYLLVVHPEMLPVLVHGWGSSSTPPANLVERCMRGSSIRAVSCSPFCGCIWRITAMEIWVASRLNSFD
ncbi:hypothetical protein Zm00014a_022123 [Zea mays]|uniref:DUF4220 domain-containing protein n=1 Tax=Zea mays TaxID=4577 RepID=A0A3L6FBF3_MAIZE|nr:hypothetical protein Zm00014a_022123 [Zea mays]